jgi:GT2 family glycosyltransferase/glycosyltransferase involved in cell wall biosynthesis
MEATGTNLTPAPELEQLLNAEGDDFLIATYLLLLSRRPDPKGFQHYRRMPLRSRSDKLRVLLDIYRSPEARQRGTVVEGLEEEERPAMRRKIALPWVHGSGGRNLHVAGQPELGRRLLETERRLASLEAEMARQRAAMSLLEQSYRELARASNSATAPALIEASSSRPASVQPAEAEVRQGGQAKAAPSARLNIEAYFMAPASAEYQDAGGTFTNLMHYIWSSRMDLQQVFDLATQAGRIEYKKWFLMCAREEYRLTRAVFPDALIEELIALGGDAASAALLVRDLPIREAATSSEHPTEAAGANLIGYAFGEFGMGEHVRMVARALDTSDYPFTILDQQVGIHGQSDLTVRHWVGDAAKYGINVFHVNADVFPPLYFNLGRDLFVDHHNIGFWAWELAQCPEEFGTAMNMVDEIWAISEFVADSFRTRSPVPVYSMPLAVTVPQLPVGKYTKQYFGLPEGKFAFLFTFDAASYLDRKNPFAAVRAFRIAARELGDSAVLVLKTMNTNLAGGLWHQLVAEIGDDPRIIVLSQRLTREEVFGLYAATDAFVSLHRSEGFGRCVAEAMSYGKPVIVTDYSGTSEFAKPHTACLVEYTLVPVPENAYPFWRHQVWADPSADDAAKWMVRVVRDSGFRERIAEAGRKYVLDRFNEEVVGKKYAARLREIEAQRVLSDAPKVAAAAPPEIMGSLDAPLAERTVERGDLVEVEGWACSEVGVTAVMVLVDGERAGEAHYGTLRPDVAGAYPHIQNAGRSGFCFRLASADLTAGRHEVSAHALTPTGHAQIWTARIEVADSRRYEGWREQHLLSVHGQGRFAYSARSAMEILVIPGQDAAALPITLAALHGQCVDVLPVTVIAAAWGGDRGDLLLEFPKLDLRWVPWSGAAACVAARPASWWTVIASGVELHPGALARFARSAAETDADFLYSDHEFRNGGGLIPVLKPGWSPLLLEGVDYIGGAWVARGARLLHALRQFSPGAAAQCSYALLRGMERQPGGVAHIPEILHLCAAAEPARPRTVVRAPVEGRVTIVVPTCLGDEALFTRCLDSLQECTHADVEVIVITNNTDAAHASAFLSKWPVKALHWDAPFNWSAVNNLGARAATGDYLLFLNDDVEITNPDWITVLLQTLVEQNAGAVGPLLLYPNGTVQHAGIAFTRNTAASARHLFQFVPPKMASCGWLLDHPREVAAVTGACLLTRRSTFLDIGGFDESLALVCNDADYCLRLKARGLRVIVDPTVSLIHHEGVSREGLPETKDVAVFSARWDAMLEEGDPYFHPRLDAARNDWALDSNAIHACGVRMVGHDESMKH